MDVIDSTLKETRMENKHRESFFKRKFWSLKALSVGFVVITGLFAYFSITGTAIEGVGGFLEAAGKVREEEYRQTHPSYDELIDCTIRDVCRLVTFEAEGLVDVSMTASRGSDLARFLGADAEATVNLIVPVVVRAGVDLGSSLPEHSLSEGILQITLDSAQVFGWHIVPEKTLLMNNEVNRPCFYDVYLLHTDLVTSIHDSVNARMNPCLDDAAQEAMTRTEDMLRERIIELGIANDVVVNWRRD